MLAYRELELELSIHQQAFLDYCPATFSASIGA